MHKKFTFDDLEDSYWNENGQRSNVFDDIPSRQVAARLAMANLFDSDSPMNGGTKRGGRGDGPPSVPRRDSPPTVPGSGRSDGSSKNSADLPTPTSSRKDTVNVDKPQVEVSPPRYHPISSNTLPSHTIGVLPGRPSTASLISECSASSLPSEANKLDLDYNRLRAEHRKLQKHLESVRNDRFRALDVNEAVRRMLTGENVSLDLYRSREDKINLLDAAIAIVDHNVILAVLFFLKSTLIDALFRDILLRRPEAAEVYMEHLKDIRDINELTTTLFALGRNEEAAMIELMSACRHKDVRTRRNAVKRCLSSSFSDPSLSCEAALISDHINLIERQIEIEETDKKIASSHSLMKLFPQRAALTGVTTMATLYYSCLYHFDLPPSNVSSPQSLSTVLRVSEKEFIWTAVSALVRQSRWPDIERVLQLKSVVQPSSYARGLLNRAGMTKLSCPFSWKNLFKVLHLNGSQPPMFVIYPFLCHTMQYTFLARILRSVRDDDERLLLTQKARVTEIVIDSLVSSREKEKLAAYAATLTPNTPDAFKAIAALNNTSIKWKS